MCELNRCPFCGGEKLKIEKKSALAGFNGLGERVENHTFSVRCNICHARGGVSGGKVIANRHFGTRDAPDWATTDEVLKKRAIDAWNRRVSNGV